MNTRQARAAERRRKQQRNIILLVTGGLLILIAAGFLLLKDAPVKELGPAQVGQPLGDFSLTDIAGRTVQLSDYAGKFVLINAWATWCPPCKAEMPDLNAFYETYQDNDFIILAVNGGDPASEAAAFADQVGLTFPVLLDPNTQVLDSLGVHSYPTSILVGPDGVVKTIHIGMFTPEMLEEEITPFILE
jgi:peroxiredoxin